MPWLIGRKSANEKTDKKARKSPLTITNPVGFQHQTHLDPRGTGHDHGENANVYRKILNPKVKSIRKPHRDSFYWEPPNVSEEFKLDILDTFNSTFSNESDIRKARSVNCLDQCDFDPEPVGEKRSNGSFFGSYKRTWSHSADNLDNSGYTDDDRVTDMDNNVCDGHMEEDQIAPTPPPRGSSIDLSDARTDSISKSQSHNIVSNTSISSGSSGMEQIRHLSKSTENVDRDLDTPPPAFKPPALTVTDTEPYRPKSNTVPLLESSESDDERQAKLATLLAKFSAKPKRIPLSNGSSLCNSMESLDEIVPKARHKVTTPSKLIMKSTENINLSVDMTAEVPPPQGYLSAPEASYVSPRPSPPKVAPRTRPSHTEEFKKPPVPKPRRQKSIDSDDEDDCITDL